MPFSAAPCSGPPGPLYSLPLFRPPSASQISELGPLPPGDFKGHFLCFLLLLLLFYWGTLWQLQKFWQYITNIFTPSLHFWISLEDNFSPPLRLFIQHTPSSRTWVSYLGPCHDAHSISSDKSPFKPLLVPCQIKILIRNLSLI
jgi:hypothetical protein